MKYHYKVARSSILLSPHLGKMMMVHLMHLEVMLRDPVSATIDLEAHVLAYVLLETEMLSLPGSCSTYIIDTMDYIHER